MRTTGVAIPGISDESKLEFSCETTDIVMEDSFENAESVWNEAGSLAQIGYWSLEVETMTLSWSKVVYEIHGLLPIYKPDLNTALHFFTEKARREVAKAIQAAIDKAQSFDMVQPLVTTYGKKIWVRIVAKPLISNGNVLSLLGFMQNVDETTRETNELKGQVKKLGSQNHQLIEFNNMLTHNIRSPISSLSMLLHLYEMEHDEHEKQELFDAIKMASSSVNDLLDELMEAVRSVSTETVVKEDNDLLTAINRTTELLKGDILQHNATIKLELNGWNSIHYPKVYLESILLNLMSNAIKYRAHGRNPVITIRTAIEDSCKVMYFQDNGSGIDMERYGDKVFKLYRVFHRDRPGKGLGLFMTKGQVEAMGGEITINSEQDKGTRFAIIFDKYKKMKSPL